VIGKNRERGKGKSKKGGSGRGKGSLSNGGNNLYRLLPWGESPFFQLFCRLHPFLPSPPMGEKTPFPRVCPFSQFYLLLFLSLSVSIFPLSSLPLFFPFVSPFVFPFFLLFLPFFSPSTNSVELLSPFQNGAFPICTPLLQPF